MLLLELYNTRYEQSLQSDAVYSSDQLNEYIPRRKDANYAEFAPGTRVRHTLLGPKTGTVVDVQDIPQQDRRDSGIPVQVDGRIYWMAPQGLTTIKGMSETPEELVGFHLDTELAYQAVMRKFGNVVSQDPDSGIMYVPASVWTQVEQVAYDADGIGAEDVDGGSDYENPEHYGVEETSDYFRRRQREEEIISGKRTPRKKHPAQTSDYARRREQEKNQGVAEARASGETTFWRVEQSDATGRYHVVTGYQKRKIWKNELGAVDFVSKDSAQKKADELNQKSSVAEGDLDRFKKYTRPVVKTTPKIERTTNPSGRTTDHVEWKVTSPTGEIHRYNSKKQAQQHFDSFSKQGVAEEWSQKYKSSINCSHPKGFSQKAHCAGKKKHNESLEMEMICPDCGMSEASMAPSKPKYDAAWDEKVQRLGQMAKQGERKIIWDPVKRVYKTVPVNPVKPTQENIFSLTEKNSATQTAQSVNEDSSTSSAAAEQAIIKRIMTAHVDLLRQFGPEKVMQAAEQVAYGVGDLAEIGTSDVSGWVQQVRQLLGAP